MRLLRPLLLLAGLGALATSVPCLASPLPAGPGRPGADPAGAVRALALLDAAARSASVSPWSGLQQVTSWRSGAARTAVLAIVHDPRTGSLVTDVTDPLGSTLTVPADVLDDHLVTLLAARYDLALAAPARCAGHTADVVEARRRGVAGVAGLAARFWVDRASGLMLRRDVMDGTGTVVGRSAMTWLDLSTPAAFSVAPVSTLRPVRSIRPSGRRVTRPELADLRTGAPAVLPGGLELFDARRHDDGVLQLSYSDGLSTLSLFLQPGAVPPGLPGAMTSRGGRQVRTLPGGVDQLVWAGAGRTWTLVSDAPRTTVDDAVAALPHSATRRTDAMHARAWRGLSRVGSWLNPFD